jgi:hypothetical protein
MSDEACIDNYNAGARRLHASPDPQWSCASLSGPSTKLALRHVLEVVLFSGVAG